MLSFQQQNPCGMVGQPPWPSVDMQIYVHLQNKHQIHKKFSDPTWMPSVGGKDNRHASM